MILKKIKWEHIVLLLIVLVGFSIRIVNLYGDYPFQGNDSPFLATFSIRLASFDNPLQNFLELMNFRWGATTPFLLALNIFFFNLLGIKITETGITLPIVIGGTLTILMIYLLGAYLKNRYVGLLSAAFLAVLPIHAAQSRDPGGIWIVGPLLLSLSIYLLMKYFFENKYGFWASLSLSFYMLSSSLFLGILLIIPFIIFLSIVEKDKKFRKKERNLELLKASLPLIIKKIFRIKNFILPVLFLGISVISFFIFLYYGFNDFSGYIGHMINRASGGFGIYAKTLFMDFVADCGIYLTIVFIIVIVYSIKKLISLEKESIFFIWTLVYILPFLFFISPKVTVVKTYLNEAIIPMIILMSIFFFDTIKYLSSKQSKKQLFKMAKISFILIFVLVFALTSITIMGIVHRVPKGYHSLQGSIYPNTGAKTSGYFIRENYNQGPTLFTDLRPATGHYYFHMPVLSSTDMDEIKLFSYFNSVSKDVDLVVFKEENYGFIKPYLNNFTKLVEITSKGKTVMYIYSKNATKSEPIILDTKKYDKLFDEKYGNIESLNFGFEEQIKGNKQLYSLVERLKNSFFGFLF